MSEVTFRVGMFGGGLAERTFLLVETLKVAEARTTAAAYLDRVGGAA